MTSPFRKGQISNLSNMSQRQLHNVKFKTSRYDCMKLFKFNLFIIGWVKCQSLSVIKGIIRH